MRSEIAQPVVGDEVAVRHENDLFAEEGEIVFRDYRPVGDDVVDIGRAHRAGIAHVVDLNGSGPPRQDIEPVVGREAHQVDGDIDLTAAQELGDLLIGIARNIDEMLECVF